jgi:hypothetical protein
VNAEQFDPKVIPWPNGVRMHTGVEQVALSPGQMVRYLFSPSRLIVPVPIGPGDWIVEQDDGTRRLVKKEVFSLFFKEAFSE